MIVVAVNGVIGRGDIRRLCRRVRVLLEESGAEFITCDVSDVAEPDACTVDALARLSLTARRLGREVRLVHAGRDLQELVSLMGLDEVLPVLQLEPRGQAEQGEERGGVEEETDPGDLTA